MARWLRVRMTVVMVLILMAASVAMAASGVAQEATPTAGEGTPTDGGAAPTAGDATPIAEEGVAPGWAERQACPDPGTVDQTFMIEDEDEGRYLTVRLLARSEDVAPWAGEGDAIARVKWGRICVEPDTLIAAEDGGDQSYPAIYVIYDEAGELVVSLTPDLANGGYAYVYYRNDETQDVSTERHLQAGDMIVMANATATFANRSADEPATIVAVQVAEPGDGTGCSNNCWLPSCFMPVAQQPPTCADTDESTP